MTSFVVTYGAWITIAVMTAATVAVRAGGFWLMGRVPLTPRLRKMLAALPGAVVVATVLPLALREGSVAILAVATAVSAMAVWRNDLVAVLVGIGTAALLRWWLV